MVMKKDCVNDDMLKCRYCHPRLRKNNAGVYTEYHCVQAGWEDDKVKIVQKTDCKECNKFDSRYIEFPLSVNKIKNEPITVTGIKQEIGCLCKINPCAEEYCGKTYIGIYIGDLPIAIYNSFNKETGVLSNKTMNNPAIYVPEFKKIIYGCESWWQEITSIEELERDSERNINDTWYLQFLKQ